MDRTFHSRTRWDQIIYIIILGLLCFYMLWVKQPILGAIIAILLLIIIERVINTTYTIGKNNLLLIKRGRFSKSISINIDDINDIELRRSARFGTISVINYVLITYAKTKHIGITPSNTERFIELIIKRKEQYKS